MLKKYAIPFIVLFFFTACASVPRIDPTAYSVDKEPKWTPPKVCRASYESVIPKVAVVNFTNNTTFDYASVVQANVKGASQRSAAGGAAVGVAPGGAGVVWAAKEQRQFQRDSETTQRQITAKLSESVEDGVMDTIVNIGGAKVYTRKEMEKIFSEQKLQQSGLVDESTLVRLGKLVGVKYIITGSVNNVDLAYTSYESARKGARDTGKEAAKRSEDAGAALASLIAGSVVAAALEAMEGWNIGAEITLRILDVETGEVLLSDKVTGKQNIGKIPYPNYDALIGGIKKAASKGLDAARPKLSKYFTVRGYISQLRSSANGKERIARLSIGEKVGVKPGTKLNVSTFEEMEDEDPATGNRKVTCNQFKLPVELTVSDQIQADGSWAVIEGKRESVQRVKVGQLVERKPVK